MAHGKFENIQRLFGETVDIFRYLLEEMSDGQRGQLYQKSRQTLINDHTIDEAMYLVQSVLVAANNRDAYEIKKIIRQYDVFLAAIGEFFERAGAGEKFFTVEEKMEQWGPVIICLVELYNGEGKEVA